MVSPGKSKAVSALHRKANKYVWYVWTQFLISFENESSGNLTKKQRQKGKEIAPGNLSFSFVLRAVTEGRKKLMVDRGVCGVKLYVIILAYVVRRKGLCWCF